MALTVTKGLSDLKVLFNDVEEIYFKSGEVTTADFGTADLAVDMELPVLEDGVSFDTGAADVTRTKLTTGTIWTSRADKGDPDISFQVASVSGDVNDLLMTNVDDITGVTGLVSGNTYKGAAYKLAPKKVVGALIMFSEDRQSIIVLPKVEMYSSFVAADGDNPAYFNVEVTPMENSEGSDLFVLEKTTTA